jgi:hypothetical protein
LSFLNKNATAEDQARLTYAEDQARLAYVQSLKVVVEDIFQMKKKL